MAKRVLAAFLFFLGLLLPAATPSVYVDLTNFGYSAPPVEPSSFYWHPEGKTHPHFLSFANEGILMVGFITREGSSLATRERPALTLHTLAVNTRGEILDRHAFQTTDWYVNGVFSVPGPKVAVRTGTVFRLYSPEGSVLAERSIPDVKTRVLSSPDHRKFVLDYEYPEPIEVLDAETLNPEKPCPRPEHVFLESVSNGSVFVRFPYPPYGSFMTHVEVRQICGPKRFDLEWDESKLPRPFELISLDDEHFVSVDAPAVIELFDRKIMRWRDSFDRKHDSIDWSVAVDATGAKFAILVQKYVGGSDIFDVNGRLKSSKIVVYRSANGARLAEIPVSHIGLHDFEFALSPGGTTLAVLSDGDLMLTPISDAPIDLLNR